MSIQAHLLQRQTIACDYESLAYCLLELYMGKVRWFAKSLRYIYVRGSFDKRQFAASEHSSKLIERLRLLISRCHKSYAIPTKHQEEPQGLADNRIEVIDKDIGVTDKDIGVTEADLLATITHLLD